jgi:hypothetical protein
VVLSNLYIDLKFNGLISAVSQFPTFKASFQVQDAEKIAANFVRIFGNTVGRLGNLRFDIDCPLSTSVLYMLSSKNAFFNSLEIEALSFSGNESSQQRQEEDEKKYESICPQ